MVKKGQLPLPFFSASRFVFFFIRQTILTFFFFATLGVCCRSLSRHPNYFGECVLWCGSYLVSSGAFSAAQEAMILPRWMARVAMFSPVFVTVLITRVSGIPLLEKENDRRLKDVVAYWKYKKETSMFVPTWPRSVE